MKLKQYIGRHRTNLVTYGVVILGFVIMQVLSASHMLSSSVEGFLVPICAYVVLAVSLNLVVGISGELSLGHAGFMGVGAFTGIIVAALLKTVIASKVLLLIVAIVCGGVMAGLFGVVIGLPVMRLRGDYLAIVTLAFGEILKNLINNMYVGSDANGVHFVIGTEKPLLAEGGSMVINGPMGATGVTKLATFPHWLCPDSCDAVRRPESDQFQGRPRHQGRPGQPHRRGIRGHQRYGVPAKGLRSLRLSGGHGGGAVRPELFLPHRLQVHFQYLHQHSGVGGAGRLGVER